MLLLPCLNFTLTVVTCPAPGSSLISVVKFPVAVAFALKVILFPLNAVTVVLLGTAEARTLCPTWKSLVPPEATAALLPFVKATVTAALSSRVKVSVALLACAVLAPPPGGVTINSYF